MKHQSPVFGFVAKWFVCFFLFIAAEFSVQPAFAHDSLCHTWLVEIQEISPYDPQCYDKCRSRSGVGATALCRVECLHLCDTPPLLPEMGDQGDCGDDGKGCPVWRVNKQNLNIYVTDTPLWYQSPVGPNVELRLSYNSLAPNQTFGFGRNWLLNYGTHIVLEPNVIATVVMPDGAHDLYIENSDDTYTPPSDVYNHLSAETNGEYRLQLYDGRVFHYSAQTSDQNLLQLVRVTDVNGLSLNLGYSSGRLATITDALGRQTQLLYNTNDQLALVTDPFGRQATFVYDSSGDLVAITDMGGYLSLIVYDDAGFVERIDKPEFGSWEFDVEPADVGPTPTEYPAPGATMGDHYRVTITDPLSRKTEYFYDALLEQSFVVMPKHYQPYVDNTVNNAEQPRSSYLYSNNGSWIRLIEKRNEFNETWAYTYTSNGLITSKTDETDSVDTYSYNSDDQQITELLDDGGENRAYSYNYLDADSLLVTRKTGPSVFSGGNRLVDTTYDANRFPDVVTISGFTPGGNAVSRSQNFDFNTQGQLLRVDGPRIDVNDVSLLTYHGCSNASNPECGQVASFTNPLNQTLHFEAYTDGGLVSRLRNANNRISEFEYDGLNRITRHTYFHASTPSDQRVIQFSYQGAKQHVSSITLPDGIQLSYQYDNAEQLISVTDNLGNQVRYQYDENGNRSVTELLDPQDQMQRRVEFSFDAIDQLREISEAGSNTLLAIDAKGQLLRSIDPKYNPPTDYEYDALERLTRKFDALGNITQWDYDVNDQIVQMTAPNNVVTQMVYDDLGNRLSETSADRGITTYTHDAAGNPVSMTDARGITITYRYDALGRITEANTGDLETVSYEYDNCANGVGYLCRIVGPDGTTEFAYDVWGNVASMNRAYTAFQNTQNYLTQYEYDIANRVTRLTYPSGRSVRYQYDAIGRVTSVFTQQSGNAEQTLLANRSYQVDGRVAAQDYDGTLSEIRSYDAHGRLANIVIDAQTMASYLYDANSNLAQIDSAEIQDFTYDELDRLSFEQGIENIAYQYDANGNRLQQTIDSQTVAYNYLTSSNRLQSIDTDNWQTDSAGNVTAYQDLQFDYNARGQLAQSTNQGRVVDYAYDSRWQRVRKRHGSWLSDYHYDHQGRLLAISDGNGLVQTEYVYADSRSVSPFARIQYSTSAATVENTLANASNTNPNTNFVCEPEPGSVQQATAENRRLEQLRIETAAEQVAEQSAQQPSTSGIKSTPSNLSWFFPILYSLLLFDDDFTFLPDRVMLDNDIDQPLNVSEATFDWQGIAGAERYVVSVADSQAALAQGQGAGVTSYCSDTHRTNVYNLTAGQTYYIRVWALVNGQWQYRDYVINRPAPSGSATTERLYLIHDHLGTPREARSADGTVHWRWQGDGFARTQPQTDVDNNGQTTTINLRLPGQYYDSETGLHYNWHRYYHPQSGRYITSDPIGLDGGLNTFGYVDANPLNWSDPSGLIFTPETVWDGVSLGVGLVSLEESLDEGNYGGAILDVVGIVADAAAFVTPVVPGGAGLGIKACREAADNADNFVDGYRAVSKSEADDIIENGLRPKPNGQSMEDKWFSETLEGAEKFKEKYPDLEDIVKVKVPKEVYDRSYKHSNIDNTGPGFCVTCSDLNRIKVD